MTRRLLSIVLSASLTVLAASAYAEDNSYMRLARLSYLEGHVSYQHSSDVDWSAASVNFPLEPGDRLYTGQDGRAEIQFDDGSIFRLAENTDLEVLSLKDELIQVRMLVGLATLTATGNVDFEIDTPAAAFSTLRKGVYRFDVIENGDSDAVVRKGELEAANNSFSRRIESGELLHVRVGGDGSPSLSRYNRRDQWDEWNDRRNADMQAYASRNHLPENVYIGASDLDRYGRWVEVDTYGRAWVPSSVDAYWSPYSVGRWCYRPFYGWTWVSYETWGWLPYHYGRWHRSASFGWCWIPGPAFSFNFWSPGLVVFYNGPGWVSWCPLGPGDYYNINHYHFNHRVFGYQLAQLRGLHTRSSEDPFNRHVRGAFRTVEIEHFKSGSFNDRSAGTRWRDIDEPWRHGSLVKNRLNVQPSQLSFRPAPDRPTVQPRVNNSMPVIVRSNPSINAGSRERFSPITNMRIPAVPSRELRSKNEPGSIENRNSGSDINRQAIPDPQREPADRGNRTIPGSGIYNQDGRWMNTPRRLDNRDNGGVNAGSAPAARPDNAPSNETGNRDESKQRAVPIPQKERVDANAPNPSRSVPNLQEGRRMDTHRPSGNNDSGSSNSGSAPAPRRDNTPSYRQIVPRQNNENPSVKEAPAPSEKPKKEESQPERRAEPRSNASYFGRNPNTESRAPVVEYAPIARSRSYEAPSDSQSNGIHNPPSLSFRGRSDNEARNLKDGNDSGNRSPRR
jgi:hypothetical protein